MEHQMVESEFTVPVLLRLAEIAEHHLLGSSQHFGFALPEHSVSRSGIHLAPKITIVWKFPCGSGVWINSSLGRGLGMRGAPDGSEAASFFRALALVTDGFRAGLEFENERARRLAGNRSTYLKGPF